MRSICVTVSLLLLLGLAGCGLLVLSTAAVVGTVGAAGYTVYKGGEAVVSGVSSVGSSAKSLVVSDGTLKAECEYTVAELYPAAQSTLHQAGFKSVRGTQDSLSGALQATTAFNEQVFVLLTLLEKNLTRVQIKIGEGNLEQSEFLYDQMLAKVEGGSEGTQ